MARFNLSQLVNKSLYAKSKVNARSAATTASNLLYTFSPGEYIGVIFSGLSRPDGTWLQIDRNLAGKPVTFFVKASAAGLDVDGLRNQGAIDVDQERKQEIEDQKPTGQKIFEKVQRAAIIVGLAVGTFQLLKLYRKK